MMKTYPTLGVEPCAHDKGSINLTDIALRNN